VTQIAAMRKHAVRTTQWAIAAALVVALIGLVQRPAAADAPFFGAAAPASQPVVDIAATPTGNGYWLVASDGGVFSFGDAAFHGSLGAIPLAAPITAIVPTPSGAGYWLFATDGGVFAFGDARFLGSLGGLTLARPVVDAIATTSGNGYWLVAGDGGVFSFGDAAFHGSTGGLALVAPITAVLSTPGGNGYWLVATDGGVFSFGDAPFRGSLGDLRLVEPIVDATRSADGYWLVASDGGVFSFGDAPYYGSAAAYGRLNAPMVSIASHPSHSGYWTTALDGGVFGFDASWQPPSSGAVISTPLPGGVGPSNPGALRPSGSITVNTAGAVIENIDVSGQITINAPGVTIRNFRANNIVNNGHSSTFEDGEIHGQQNSSADGVTGSGYTARRLNVHHVNDGFKAGTNTTIEGSWIHDLVFVSNGGSWTHNDGVQVMSGSNIIIRNNVFERNRGNAAVFLKPDFGRIDNVIVDNNILGGGGYTLYSIDANGYGAPSNVRIRNNVFTEEHLFGYAVANPGTGWEWANNTNQSNQTVNPGGW